ncbi:hypothetical protein Tco_1178919 [Tanacetum coccineum]
MVKYKIEEEEEDIGKGERILWGWARPLQLQASALSIKKLHEYVEDDAEFYKNVTYMCVSLDITSSNVVAPIYHLSLQNGRESGSGRTRSCRLFKEATNKAGYPGGSRERPVQRSSWVPPQPPPVAMAEAAAAIRQPKKS